MIDDRLQEIEQERADAFREVCEEIEKASRIPTAREANEAIFAAWKQHSQRVLSLLFERQAIIAMEQSRAMHGTWDAAAGQQFFDLNSSDKKFVEKPSLFGVKSQANFNFTPTHPDQTFDPCEEQFKQRIDEERTPPILLPPLPMGQEEYQAIIDAMAQEGK